MQTGVVTAAGARGEGKCPKGQRLATVRSAEEQTILEAALDADKQTVSGQSWNGLWLGGKWDKEGKKGFVWDAAAGKPKIAYNGKWASNNGPTAGNRAHEPWICYDRAHHLWHDCNGWDSEKLGYVCETRHTELKNRFVCETRTSAKETAKKAVTCCDSERVNEFPRYDALIKIQQAIVSAKDAAKEVAAANKEIIRLQSESLAVTGDKASAADATWGATRPGCRKTVSPIQAAGICRLAGKVLCSQAQIRAGAGKGTGCSFDDQMVWTRDPCYAKGEGPTLVMKGCDATVAKHKVTGNEFVDNKLTAACDPCRDPSITKWTLYDENGYNTATGWPHGDWPGLDLELGAPYTVGVYSERAAKQGDLAQFVLADPSKLQWAMNASTYMSNDGQIADANVVRNAISPMFDETNNKTFGRMTRDTEAAADVLNTMYFKLNLKKQLPHRQCDRWCKNGSNKQQTECTSASPAKTDECLKKCAWTDCKQCHGCPDAPVFAALLEQHGGGDHETKPVATRALSFLQTGEAAKARTDSQRQRGTRGDNHADVSGITKWATPTCGYVTPSELYSHKFDLPPDPLGMVMHPLGPVVLTIKFEISLILGLEGIVTNCVDDAPTYSDQATSEYGFMAGLAPFFTLGVKVTASVELPFIFSVSLYIQVDFVKFAIVSTLTAGVAKKDRKEKGTKDLISTGDLYINTLRGEIGIFITFLPRILDIELPLANVKFPGAVIKDGDREGELEFACVSYIGKSGPECPEYFYLNSPGKKGRPGTLSQHPISMWCTDDMCRWSKGRKKEEDLAESDQSEKFSRGKCKQSYHCHKQDFDGVVVKTVTMDNVEVIHGLRTMYSKWWPVRTSSNYRSESDHQDKGYDKSTGRELVFGVLLPIKSYVAFTVKGASTSCGIVDMTSGTNGGYRVYIGFETLRSKIVKWKKGGTERSTYWVKHKKSPCNDAMGREYWVRADSAGLVAFGMGITVDKEALGKWQDPDNVHVWITKVRLGTLHSGVVYTDIEVNRGQKHDSYCYKVNPISDPDKKGYARHGNCYRKMPDSLADVSKDSFKCNDGTSMDTNSDACLSGVCRDFGVGVLRCTGCYKDDDCKERTFLESSPADQNAQLCPGKSEAVSEGYVSMQASCDAKLKSGAVVKGNRPVCALQDPLAGSSKKKKHFCQSRGRLGMWCSKQAHCDSATQFCDAVPPRCILKFDSKRKNYAGRACTGHFMCKSNKCDAVCVECRNEDHGGCTDKQYCDFGVCYDQIKSKTAKWAGESCTKPRQCKSGKCDIVCVECNNDNHAGCNIKTQYCSVGVCYDKKDKYETCSLPKTGDIECLSGTCTTVRVGARSHCRPKTKFPTGKTFKSQCVPIVGNKDCQSDACAMNGFCTDKCTSHNDCGTAPAVAVQFVRSANEATSCPESSTPIILGATCEAYGRSVGKPYGGIGSSSSQPKGCAVTGSYVWFNTAAGRASAAWAVACTKIPFMTSAMGTASCPLGSQAIDTNAQCKIYSKVLKRGYGNVGSWGGQPKGCAVGYAAHQNWQLWWNTHSTGSTNDAGWGVGCVRVEDYCELGVCKTNKKANGAFTVAGARSCASGKIGFAGVNGGGNTAGKLACQECFNHGTTCGTSSFCNMGTCATKLTHGTITALGAGSCVSGVVGFLGVSGKQGSKGFVCQQCINHDSRCGSNRFCDMGTCATKLTHGTITALGAGSCVSGIVGFLGISGKSGKDGLACQQCINHDSKCGNNNYCNLGTCAQKENHGKATTLGAGACRSGKIGSAGVKDAGTVCQQCFNYDSTCGSKNYCNVGTCREKLNAGTTTTLGAGACKSGKIGSFGVKNAGTVCHDCFNGDSTCGSGNYCNVGTCNKKLKSGTVTTLGARACTSGIHNAGACRQCASNSHCHGGGHDASKCWENGKHDGDCCALRSAGSCKSGTSIEWRSSTCWIDGHKKYYQYYCKPKQFCGEWTCRGKLNAGTTTAYGAGACKSGKIGSAGVENAGTVCQECFNHDSTCGSGNFCDAGTCRGKLEAGTVTTLGAGACKSGRIGNLGVKNAGTACQECFLDHPEHCGGGTLWGKGCFRGVCKDRKWWPRKKKYRKCGYRCKYGLFWYTGGVCGDHDCNPYWDSCPVILMRSLTAVGHKCWDWD